MAEHVDLVKNEWLAGMQVRLATVVQSDGDVALANVTPGWEDLLTRPLRDASGGIVYLSKEPRLALDTLSQFFTSEYVFATDRHDESKCPFGFGGAVAMRRLRTKSS